jgi:hypothetical protein
MKTLKLISVPVFGYENRAGSHFCQFSASLIYNNNLSILVGDSYSLWLQSAILPGEKNIKNCK